MRRIGIDFDNTIIRYDEIFARAAIERGWSVAGARATKTAIRDAIRRLPDGEEKWQCLQAAVYGPLIDGAELFVGVMEFLRVCQTRGWSVVIVSHKTEYANFGDGQIKLTDAARSWMGKSGLTGGPDAPIDVNNIYFEPTRAAKIARIRALECTDFIDDLVEVFSDPEFPPEVRKILFSLSPEDSSERWIRCADWSAITETFLRCESRSLAFR